MGRKRTITVVFEDMEDDEYNEVANAVWSVANLTKKPDHVRQDGYVRADDLNRW